MKNNSERKQDSEKKETKLAGRTVKTDPNLHIPKKVAGGATGTMVGALVAGPIGAVVGGVVGTFIGAAAAKGGIQAKKARKAPGSASTKAKSTVAQRKPQTGKSGGTAKKPPARANS